jgi:hypothetical protein
MAHRWRQLTPVPLVQDTGVPCTPTVAYRHMMDIDQIELALAVLALCSRVLGPQ